MTAFPPRCLLVKFGPARKNVLEPPHPFLHIVRLDSPHSCPYLPSFCSLPSSPKVTADGIPSTPYCHCAWAHPSPSYMTHDTRGLLNHCPRVDHVPKECVVFKNVLSRVSSVRPNGTSVCNQAALHVVNGDGRLYRCGQGSASVPAEV